MTKHTMIWQAVSWLIAGMVRKNEIPETAELFEKKLIADVKSVLDYSDEDIKYVLHNYKCTEFALILSKIAL